MAIALGVGEGLQIVPDPDLKLAAEAEMLRIGSIDAEERFLELYPDRGAEKD